MKKRLTVLAMSVLLNGCFNDMSEVQNYVADVKANTKARVEPIPELQEFEHVAYRSQEARSPFSAPKPEAIQDKFLQVQDCLHSDPRRRKEPLEKYAVDNLKMRGTLDEVSEIYPTPNKTQKI